jgi:thiamine biosynthesis lipoprotein
MIRIPEQVMGTVVSLAIEPGPQVSGSDLWLAAAEVRAGLHKADAVFSTWKAHSPMSRLRRGETELAQCPPDVEAVLDLCRMVREQSGGWFDPWALPGGVDPTGLVKGWAAARALDRLETAGVASAVISAGGDLGTVGTPPGGRPWRVGIAHPWRPGALAAVVELTGPGAVCTSGTYQRGAHLIDPHTGVPATRAISATVTGPDLAVADGLATGLAVGGEAALAAIDALPGYQGWLIRPDGTDASTAGWQFAPGRCDPAGRSAAKAA